MWTASLLLLAGVPVSTARAQQPAWQHEPPHWSERAGVLTETVPADTDYWRTTHYGFVHDNGPFRYVERSGNFETRVHVTGHYAELYHQAGLMIRAGERQWIKAGVEFVNGKQNISTVVTREFSDWSVLPRADNPSSIWLRLQRFNDTVQVSYSLDGQKWSMTRLAYFPPQISVQVGMVAAAPGKQPFQVSFDHFSLRELSSAPKED